MDSMGTQANRKSSRDDCEEVPRLRDLVHPAVHCIGVSSIYPITNSAAQNSSQSEKQESVAWEHERVK